jgi:hypothetical protein
VRTHDGPGDTECFGAVRPSRASTSVYARASGVGCGCEQKQSECSDNVAKCVCDHGMTLSHMCAWYDCTGGEEGMPLRVSMARANAVAE